MACRVNTSLVAFEWIAQEPEVSYDIQWTLQIWHDIDTFTSQYFVACNDLYIALMLASGKIHMCEWMILPQYSHDIKAWGNI